VHPLKNPFSAAIIVMVFFSLMLKGDRHLYWIPVVAGMVTFVGYLFFIARNDK